MRVALCHVIMCIAFAFVFNSCIQLCSTFSPLSVLKSDTHTRTHHTFEILFCEREKNILGMGRELMSGLGISPVNRLSNFVPFRGRLMPQWLTALTAGHFCTPRRTGPKPSFSLQPNTSPQQPNSPTNSPPCSSPSDHDRVGENGTSIALF